MARVIVDFLRRHGWIYAGLATVSVLLWLQLGLAHPFFSLAQVLADTICLASFAGPIIAMVNWPSREYAVLPLSARDLWRARWLVAVAAPSSAVVVGAAVAVAGLRISERAPAIGVEQLALAGVMSFTMCGVIFGTAPLIGMAMSSRHRPRRAAEVTLLLLTMMAILSAPLAPAVFASYLPTTWSQFSPTWAVGLIVALALVISGYFRAVRLVVAGNPVTSRARGKGAAAPAPTRLDSRISGLSGLIVKGAFGPIGMIVTFVLLQVLGGDRGFAFDNWTSLLISATVIYWSWWPGPSPVQLRLLRVLPMSRNRLNLTLLAPSVVGWACAWLSLLALDLILAQPFFAFGLHFLCLLAGYSALGIACQLRWRWGRAVGAVVLIVGLVADRRLNMSFTTTPLDVLAGLAMLAIAWFLNAHTLSRTSAPYRRASSSWGKMSPASR